MTIMAAIAYADIWLSLALERLPYLIYIAELLAT